MNISNNDRWHSDDWIKNVQTLLLPVVQKIHKEYCRRENTRPGQKERVKKYEKSLKGKISRKRVDALRHKRIRHFEISHDEKEMIRQFYVDCPKGMHVDHIIPISRGGQHSLSNLQWLDATINAQKQAKSYKHDCEFPHCLLDNSKYL